MSKAEREREQRESEGDPQVKAARRRAHREALSGSALQAVERASVLLVSSTSLAVALSYDEEHDRAPKLLALGEGELAARMIETARLHDVPCVRDVGLVSALRELGVGDEIPEAHYEAVAEILRELWRKEPTGEPRARLSS